MSDTQSKLEKVLGSDLQVNTLLRDFVSMKVGGVADYFYTARDINSLTEAVTVAHEIGLPYFILGGGYNVIPSDLGFPGLVIKNESANIAFSPDFSAVIADSGVHLGRLINQAAGQDLGGLEFLYGIPGTVGGAIHGNAGAFKYSVGDFVRSVTVLVPREDKIVIEKHDKKWMNFEYRSSCLKNDYKNTNYKPVVLTATLQLVQRRRDEILRMMQENLKWRKSHQPLEERSAGSFFKNVDNTPEGAAGFLIDKSGAKKLRVGGAAFSKKHANFLINRKNATASDVQFLAEQAKEIVRKKYDANLEEEVEYVGKW